MPKAAEVLDDLTVCGADRLGSAGAIGLLDLMFDAQPTAEQVMGELMPNQFPVIGASRSDEELAPAMSLSASRFLVDRRALSPGMRASALPKGHTGMRSAQLAEQ
jgi:hypothetical protein